MKIAFFEVTDKEKQIFKKNFSHHTLVFYNNPLTISNLKKVSKFDVISTFIYSKINSNVINKLSKVKLIVTRSMGYDHIDVEACTEKNIKVANTPHYDDSAVAEHTFALTLALVRHLKESLDRTSKGNFSTEGLEGFDLKGKTLGVIGTGRIGAQVIRIAKGFGMNVLGYDVLPNKSLARNLKFHYTSLDNLLKKSDIITLHVPYVPSTHHLIDKKAIAKMKKSAILINTSRGAIINTKDLLSFLKRKKIAGAALDVIEGEDLLRMTNDNSHDSMEKIRDIKELLKLRNVIITPHIAFYTKEATNNIINSAVSIINFFIQNKPFNTV